MLTLGLAEQVCPCGRESVLPWGRVRGLPRATPDLCCHGDGVPACFGLTDCVLVCVLGRVEAPPPPPPPGPISCALERASCFLACVPKEERAGRWRPSRGTAALFSTDAASSSLFGRSGQTRLYFCNEVFLISIFLKTEAGRGGQRPARAGVAVARRLFPPTGPKP